MNILLVVFITLVVLYGMAIALFLLAAYFGEKGGK